jgi:hypothetical protein
MTPTAADRDRAVVRHVERAPRAMTLLITGKLVVEQFEALCRVRNMSATGMMIETLRPLSQGDEVCVHLRSSCSLRARVVWTRQGAAGLAFLTPVDLKAVLAGEAPRSRILRARRPRAPRIAAQCAITVVAGGETHEACLLDISQSGARLRLPMQPNREERLILSIPGLPMKSGAVCWAREGEAGLALYEPLPFDLLAEWIERRER